MISRPIHSFVRRGQRACAVLGACLAITVGVSANGELIDTIVAVVDGEPILRSDLLIEAREALSLLRESAVSNEQFEREAELLLRDVLESQIEAKLLLGQAEFLGATVTDEEIEESIENLRGDLSYDEFLQMLRSEGLTMAELRERRRQYILSRRMARSKLNDFKSEVVVSEEQVQEYYEAHRSEYERPEEVLVSQIQLQVGSDPDARAKARARLESLRREIQAGADFAELAKLHSEDMFAEDGGRMGWHERGVLQPVLEEAVFALEEGEVTEVLETRIGLHLIRVDERREAGLRTVDEVRGEIEPKLRTEIATERYERWLSDLRKRSRVRVYL